MHAGKPGVYWSREYYLHKVRRNWSCCSSNMGNSPMTRNPRLLTTASSFAAVPFYGVSREWAMPPAHLPTFYVGTNHLTVTPPQPARWRRLQQNALTDPLTSTQPAHCSLTSPLPSNVPTCLFLNQIIPVQMGGTESVIIIVLIWY